MYKLIISLWKYIINLSPEKRTTALLLSMVIFFGLIGYVFWGINQKEHLHIINEKSTKLDTCEKRNMQYLKDIDFWKDSLYKEKVLNLSKELEKLQYIEQDVNNIQKDIINTNNKLIKKHIKIIQKINK